MANEQFVSRYRKYGEEQPYWKAGIFKIRLPFVHYKWSVPEMVQAVFMCATCLGAIPVLQSVFGCGVRCGSVYGYHQRLLL